MTQQHKISRSAYAAVRGSALPKTARERREWQIQHDRKKYLSNREAAEYLGVSESYLNKTRHFGTGPRFYRIGRAIRYAVEDLDDWMSDRSATSTREYQD